MEEIKKDLQGEDGLMFSGEPMSQEAVESLLDAMDYIVKQTKVINKNTCLRNIVIQTITDASLGGNTLKFVIRDLVQQLSTKYNTTNPYELADYLKIHVLTWDLHEEINGFINMKKKSFHCHNTNLSPSMQRTVCAHELGHAVLHTHANTPFLRKNTFFPLTN